MEKKIICVVTGIISNGNGKYLFLKRAPKSSWGSGQFQFPEGKMEWGEKPLQALEREIQEETACKANNLSLIGVTTFNLPIKDIDYHLVRIVYAGELNGKISLCEDHTDYSWFTIEEASKNNLSKSTKILFQSWQNGKI